LENKTLDARHLLFDIDQFLQTIPPAEWRRRAADAIPLGDMPLRTVKTVLQQVVAHFGEAVYEELTLIDRPENSFVYQYLFRLLNNARSVNVPAESSLSRQASQQSSSLSPKSAITEEVQTAGKAASSISATPTRLDDTRLNNALKDIFDKIGNAQKSKEGIAELYQFQKQHPE
jgi:cytoskeleton-associated protein 5